MPQYFQGKASKSGVIGIYNADLQRLVKLLPPVVRDDLPMDKESQYFVISHDMVRRLLSLSLPAKGPRCNNCLGTGVECKSYGHPMACTTCKDRHLSGTCNFAQPDTFCSDTSSEMNRFFEMSAPGFKAQAERIAQSEFLLNQMTDMYSSMLEEHYYLILCFLQQVVNTQAELDTTAFSERFAGTTEEEHFVLVETVLQIAMAQQIAPGEKIARGRGFFLLPTDNSAGLPAGWQPLLDTEFIVTTEDDIKVPLGILPDERSTRPTWGWTPSTRSTIGLNLGSTMSLHIRKSTASTFPWRPLGLAAAERSYFTVDDAESGVEEGTELSNEDKGDEGTEIPAVDSPMEVDPSPPPAVSDPHLLFNDEPE
ncbi:hypothetical protein MVEN_02255100 [Mycena venus]|uniref:Uncharacterized protein n=1 Tax=Mycena venus TaxID=2733690 RepID=A0A8H6X6I2_9AGAR|nr:hypothetical protein MVEN_02255100 [Mycena venus]